MLGSRNSQTEHTRGSLQEKLWHRADDTAAHTAAVGIKVGNQHTRGTDNMLINSENKHNTICLSTVLENKSQTDHSNSIGWFANNSSD